MSNNGKYQKFDETIKNQIDEGSKTLIGAPITTGLDNSYAINAPEINWRGYKMYDESLTSTGHFISYIESQLDLKSSATGDVWDDIKDDAYITSQINIYASSSSSTISPNIIWGDTVTEQYDGFTSYSLLPNTDDNFGWHTSVDTIPGNNPYVFMSSIYMVKSLANNILGFHGPSSRPIYLSSESGLNGNFKSTVFVRSTETVPDKPYNGAYYDTGLPKEQYAYISGAARHNDSNRISYNKGSEFKCWSDAIPAGNETLWATTAIISDDNGNLDSTAEWSTPRQMTDTATYDVEFSPNDTKPENPSDNKAQREAQGWYDPNTTTSVNWENMIWRAERSCINGIWGDWIITRIKGEQGQAGVQGAFKSTAFTRTNIDISSRIPTGGNYNNPIPSTMWVPIDNTMNSVKWSDGIPEGDKQLWSTWRTFNPSGDNSHWSNPVKVQDTQYYDVEFSYLSSIASSQKPNTNNRHKETSPYDGQIWFDPTLDPTDNDITGSYTWSDMIWRAERENINGNWSDWVITRIKGEDGLQGTPPRYYQTRYTRTSGTTLNTDYYLPIDHCNPTDEVITNHGQNWTTYIPNNTDGTPHIWQSSRKVDWYINNDTNNWAEKWEEGSTWSTPFMLDGLPGESQPIHPVLFYKWALSPTTDEHYTPGDLPSFNKGSISLNGWAESPGNPEGNNRFLWMIQGEYKLNGTTREYQLINGNSYWTNPVCLSGEDGQPGNDGDDLEFIYRVYEGPQNFDDTTLSEYDRPHMWQANSADDYKGEDKEGYSQASTKWTDNPTGVSITHKYEYCSYRRKTGLSGGKSWETFSEPFPWSIYGENGIDGDGVEYIYYRSNSITPPTGDAYPPAWTNNSNINDYFQYDDFPCIEKVTGSSWNAETNTGKKDNSYIYHGWTDEPQGVSNNTNEKYEFVSVRKKGFKQGSTTEKEWKPFSSPTLWSNYAEDGVATSMVLETDNDNVTVGVDSQNIVNNRYQTIAHIYLQYNGTPINKSYYTLTLSFAKGAQTNFDIENNNVIKYRPTQYHSDEYPIISINTNDDAPYLDIDIPKDMDMSGVNNLLSILITATCNSNIGSVTNGDVSAGSTFTRIFNLTGVELSIEDIYQIGLSTTTSHRNPQNTGFEPINLWLNSFTSTNTLRTVNEAAAKHIFISYYSTNKNISGALDPSAKSYLRSFDNITLNPNYNKHVFTAYYNSNVNSIDDVNNDLIRDDNTKFLDKEEVTGVYDGKNGVDSQSEEYIYLLTDNFDFFKNNTSKYYNVGDWKTNLLSYKDNNGISYYQYNDYPFIINNNYINTESTSYVKSIKYSSSSSYNGSGFIDGDLIIGYWTDNPQGVSEEYPYEFRVSRRYLTSASENDRWQAFETPLPWANWGHSGEDGDGVEYIYYLCDDESQSFTDENNPQIWFEDTNYQNSEYINSNSNWSDNPSGVNEENTCEYVSIRKYNNKDFKFTKEWQAKNDPTNVYSYTDSVQIYYWDLNLTDDATVSYIFNDTYVNTSDINDAISLHNILKDYYNDYITKFSDGNGITVPYNNYFISTDGSEKITRTHEIYAFSALLAHNNDKDHNNSWSGFVAHKIDENEISNYLKNVNSELQKIYGIYLYRGIIFGSSSSKIFAKSISHDKSRPKEWSPYSQPKLWAKYGKQGPAGGSGLTIDLSNPTMQIAVNSSRLIKDNQGITYTAINLYNGTQPISPTQFKVSLNSAILNDENYKPFNIRRKSQSNITYGYVISNSTNNTYKYYQWEFTGDADSSDDGLANDPFFTGDNTLTHWDIPEGGIQLPLTISYNGQDYTKHLNIIGIIDGKDGKDAETWELHCAYSTIHYNRMLDNPDYEPGSVQYSIKHVVGQTTHEILDFATVNSNLNNELSLSYWFEYNEDQIVQQSQPKIYGDENAHSSGSGIYLDNGTPVEKDTESTANYSMDPTNISGNNELVITVNVLNLRDSNNDPISNIETTLLDIIDASTNYKNVLSAANVRYTNDSISNVLSALTDYVENGNLREDDKTEVNNIIATINAVVDSLGSINRDVFVLDSNISTIYVEDKETAPVIMTREAAIAEYNGSREPTNNESGSDEELQPGESAGKGLMSTPRSINIPNTAYTSTNGKVNISDYVDSNNPNVKSVHVVLTRSGELWDEDILEVVYDGIEGVDGNGIEYIYYLSQDTEQPTFGNDWTSGDNNNYASNPTWWTPNGEVIDGYSYVGKSDFIPPAQQSHWFDHPQGVTSSRTWEYISMREYDGEKQTWGRYTSPQPWSHFGENGRDGDGIEYIYANNNYSTWTVANTNYQPNRWFYNEKFGDYSLNSNYQNTTEYILSSATRKWKDNPPAIELNSYQFVSSRKYKLITNDIINEYLTASNLDLSNTTQLNQLKETFRNTYLGKHAWLPYSKPSLWASNIPGPQGPQGPGGDGKNGYVVDWTNDQINLAVDSQGYIKPNQKKTTSLNLKSLNGAFNSTGGNSPRIKLLWAGSETLSQTNPDIGDTITLFSKTKTAGAINGKYEYADVEDPVIINGDKFKNYITFWNSDDYLNYNKNLSIVVGSEYNGESELAYIPENGLEIPVVIWYRNADITDWKELSVKPIHICGQHNGENSITYEIVPSANIVKQTSTTTFNPSSLTYIVNKYDGNNVTQLQPSDFSSSFRAHWKSNNGVISSYASSISNYSNSTYINLELYSNNKLIDIETIPIVGNGEPGSQGFTGPVVRFAGVYDTSKCYSDGSYRKDQSTAANNYSESDGPIYIDIVLYNNKYWKCNSHRSWSTGTGDYAQITKNTGYCRNNGFNSDGTSTTNNSTSITTENGKPYWVEATNFDFVATKLLYADQGLINQLSSHDFIVTTNDTNPIPVAGMTGGMKNYGNNSGSLSLLNNANHGVITNSGSSDSPTSGNDYYGDKSHVRIFAGDIWKKSNGITSYSLTYAPFNVRQDGTTYMSKAVVEGEINAKSLTLGELTFFDATDTNHMPDHIKLYTDNSGTNKDYNVYGENGQIWWYNINNGDGRFEIKLDKIFDKTSEKNKTFYILTGAYNTAPVKCCLSGNGWEQADIKLGKGAQTTYQPGGWWELAYNKLIQLIKVGSNVTLIETSLAFDAEVLKHYDLTDNIKLYGFNMDDIDNSSRFDYMFSEDYTMSTIYPMRYVVGGGQELFMQDTISVDFYFFTYLESEEIFSSSNMYPYNITDSGVIADFGSLSFCTVNDLDYYNYGMPGVINP